MYASTPRPLRGGAAVAHADVEVSIANNDCGQSIGSNDWCTSPPATRTQNGTRQEKKCNETSRPRPPNIVQPYQSPPLGNPIGQPEGVERLCSVVGRALRLGSEAAQLPLGPVHAIWPELEDAEWLATRVATGASVESIADELRCPLPTVRIALLVAESQLRHLQDFKSPTRTVVVPRRRELDIDERIKNAAWLTNEYVTNGRTLAQIASSTGCRTVDVRNALVAAGVVQRTPGVRSPRLRVAEAAAASRAASVSDRL